MDTSTFDGLREYYYLASKLVFNVNRKFEDYLDQEGDELLDRLNLAQSDIPSTFHSDLHYVEIQSVTILRYAMLPRFLGLLERVLKAASKIADTTGYSTVDGRNWLQNYVKFLKSKGVLFDNVNAELETIRKLNQLRNCVVHANGEIDACKNPAAVRSALNSELGYELSDGFIFLHDHACIAAYDAILEILSEVFAHFGSPLETHRIP